MTVYIKIKDAKAPVIKALIDYISGKEVENLDQMAMDLFNTAENYRFEPLKVDFLGQFLKCLV
jgi:hypothetical protein